MMKTRRGIVVMLGLMVAVPLSTLIATAFQMWGLGGEGVIAPARVAQPEVGAAPTAGPQTLPRGSVTNAAPAPAQPAALPAIVQAREAQAVPGRSATDFNVQAASWEAGLADADAQAGAQLAQTGKPQSNVQACSVCHGPAGITPLGGAFPNLAGLSAEYLAKQLWDFRDGARQHPLMSAIAKGLTEEEIAQLSRHYGDLPSPPLREGPPDPQYEAAMRLDTVGDGSRALPACANCHGLQGRGEGPLLPRLAGQPAVYFVDQMNGFRSGQRSNDDVGVMRAFAQRLTAEEIVGLARYYESLGAPAQQGGGQAAK